MFYRVPGKHIDLIGSFRIVFKLNIKKNTISNNIYFLINRSIDCLNITIIISWARINIGTQKCRKCTQIGCKKKQ